MTRYLAGILTTIAVGVLLVAYGLLSRPASAFDAHMMDPYGTVRVAADGSMLMPAGVTPSGGYVAYLVPLNAAGQPVQGMVAAPGYANVGVNPYAVPTVMQAPVQTAPAPRPAPARRASSRDWRKTALVIGGSSAAGAGIGGLIGGKKGALIGAAIGGGASTLYESTK